MFQHAIVVCIAPTPAGFWKLQQHLSEAGPKHLGTKLLLFPDHKSAATSVLGMCPMLMDAARRRGQQKYKNVLCFLFLSSIRMVSNTQF